MSDTLSSFVKVPSCSLYGVSKDGRVMRLTPNRCGARAGKVLKPHIGGKGYYYVGLALGGYVVKQRTVHSLVAETFIGPRPDGLQINHKNGVKTDNRVGNLEYVTCSENAKHAYRMGLTKPPGLKGEDLPWSKLDEEKVRYIRSSDLSLTALARKYGVARSSICQVRTGRTWRHVR